ncbi:TPA: hypothetical protein MFO42_22915 [Klebsiella pneumoniae]|uniref:Flagellar biosynthesis, cell-distal portion of basal-body rod n=3 Tax=Klebsiella pneumoniae TaxID=573 RepID=A0A483EBS2_KLEPN|nr:hypothetical protein EI552_19885 [Klebsiella pneumoniae]ROD87597.1 hypothetical protein C4Z05_008755 [Klebsiella pneumoniae subsp. pneumoniae]KAA1496975.1 sialate O-acetylesterase [Klebsiella pneumoniae]KAA1530963.1 sialate O-acetylesterase [Klebsiella pneumoniae]KAA1645790.1 sialate O-acetylesterase [Klebsiella pneumoniae]
MAEVPLPTPTDNAVPSTDIRDAVYAGAMLDKVVTSTELKYTDRLGGEHYTVDGIKAEGDKVVEETRQNLIPLSRQYMTLSDAQADIANIPEGSSTYVRSQDGSSLADEYINNGGTLTATGRHMPSQQAVIDVDTALRSLIDELPNDALFLFSDADGFHIADIALDQTGKPVLSLGRLSLSRNSGSVFDITDADGFTVSVDDLTNRVRALESGDILYRGISFSRNERNALEVTDADGFVVSIDDLLSRVFRTEQGKFVYVGQELQRSSENLFEITDVDGFSFALDSLIDRVDNLEKGDGNANNDLIARLESLAQSSRSSLSFPVSAPVAPLKTGVNIYIFYGQSLAIGDEAFTTVTRQPSQLGNVMLGLCVRGQYYDRTSDSTFGVVGGENKYYPLQEKRQNGADIITDPAVSTRLGETVASGFAETLKTLHNRSLGVINDEQTIIACSVTGAVGTSLSTLLKGATSTPYYQRLISCVQGHMQAAAAAGHTDVRVAGLVFLQGENDYGGTARESYLQMLNQLIDDFNADVKAITGQTDNPGFYLYQTGGTYVSQSKGNTLPVDMAQLDITSRPDAFMVAPMFPYPQAVAAKTHKSANAYRWWGCAAANAVHHIYKGMNHSPFRMVKAVYDGTRIYVPFMVPCPPLAIRPFYVVSTPTIKTDWGFTIIDGTGTLTGAALNVEIVSPSVVCITPSRPLSGNIRINLGDQLHGGGHNIADSSPQKAIFNWQYYGDNNQPAYENIPSLNDAPYPLCNFAAIQTINVETNS